MFEGRAVLTRRSELLPDEEGTDSRGELYRLVEKCAPLVTVVSAGLLLWTLLSDVASQQTWPDHEVYRRAVHAWISGGEVLTSHAPVSNDGPLPWVYPPFALLPLTPLAVLPLKLDITLLYLVNVVALVGTLYLVLRRAVPRLGGRTALAVAVVAAQSCLLIDPVANSFGQGQINIVLMGLVAFDCLVSTPRWPRGMLIGTAAAVKLVPAAFVLLFLVRGNFRAVSSVVATFLGATLSGFVVDFGASMDYWFGQGPAAAAFGSPLRGNQSVLAVLSRTDLEPTARFVGWIVLCLLLAAATAYCAHRGSTPLAVTTIGVFSLLVSPTAWSNHWVWIVPAILLMIVHGLLDRGFPWLFAAVASILVIRAAPYTDLPAERDSMVELGVLEQLSAASYVLLGAGLVLALLVTLLAHDVSAGEPPWRNRGAAPAPTGHLGPSPARLSGAPAPPQREVEPTSSR
ncbi:alpha-1,2-mannosyltransferase [Actinopolyspora saharensis]|uniref:Alpha-1,2-mannosyltransferase n=1 Tax=Actinopolyspora saharensis TaxID=995062 RepID=A0A1H1FBH0_9ACTN|nr:MULTISPECIES: glycosyltransferase family 87 protein [unclassified Actinopolyspora]SDQ98453.1 alpha-1,2-mannosyltransferase [Actinopolyspora saharensis]